MIIQEEKIEIIDDVKTKKANIPNSSPHTELANISKTTSQIRPILLYIGLFFVAVITILAIIFSIFTIYNITQNDTITNGVYIYGINVSKLSKEEAKEKISKQFKALTNKDLILISDGFETFINPSEIDLSYDIDSAINYAFNIGKTGNILTNNYTIFDTMLNPKNITPKYKINEKKLQKILNNISKDLPNLVVDSSYYVEGSNLIITKGAKGYIVDSEKSLATIKQYLDNISFVNSKIPLSLSPRIPNPININKIYEEIHKDAKNAYYTTKPYAVYPSETGIDFKISKKKAQQLVDKAKDECKIPLKTVYPKITTNMLGRKAFPDLLATFSTNYYANANRTTNLKIAARKINGTVIMPGEIFSYNKVVGERTISEGYKNAAIYANGQVVDGLAGGICQISTTLFNSALLANLKMVELYNHQFVPSYAGPGRDATVVYGSKDFKFKNTRNYAIKIECSVSGGVVKFNLYGLKEKNEYDVKINAIITSQTSSYIKSQTYRKLYKNGKRVKNEYIYSCTYKRH